MTNSRQEDHDVNGCAVSFDGGVQGGQDVRLNTGILPEAALFKGSDSPFSGNGCNSPFQLSSRRSAGSLRRVR
ncbi:hypothetical protein [Streptomyces sp. NPDC005078]|uniref:hypothetical protein n=1 Tax=unclassified Streptomyces TaxID=2593676 RepID=UPI0033AC6C50